MSYWTETIGGCFVVVVQDEGYWRARVGAEGLPTRIIELTCITPDAIKSWTRDCGTIGYRSDLVKYR